MKTASQQAQQNRDLREFESALDAFGQANDWFGHDDDGTLLDTENLMEAFESQGVLPLSED